ncbi:spermatogenesis-associated protein 7 isoform X2 [Ambystoma mexicanum]|uniref:spermatogenesis-associated protein 7 isoform X2 n=1 Tax=Ambystoma mexicanum TaxID=8296 RepID=UPI0037E96A54
MGVRGENMEGTRRRVTKSPCIPRCGLASPLKGHFSTKSNAFCTGSSGRLSDQYRIRDHMVAHYSKILSAKAAVDCSLPKSMTTSIKYSDQQRREKLKKDISRFEKVLSLAYISRPGSSDHSRSASAVPKKSLFGTEDNNAVSLCMENQQISSARSCLSSPEQCLVSPMTAAEIREAAWKSVNSSVSGLSIGVSSIKRLCNTFTPSDASTPKEDSFLKFQDPSVKTYSGDLLEKHSHHFTHSGQPFRPRTLKTQAKSVLSQYRYYTPPRRKRREGLKEAGTQTDMRRLDEPLKQDVDESQTDTQSNQDTESVCTSDMDERLDSCLAAENRKAPNQASKPQSTLPREEELQYLEFVAAVTNEILTLGLFSNRVLERVFARHVEQNRDRLDEGKMHHLLDVLRADLGCKMDTPEKPSSIEFHNYFRRESLKSQPPSDNEKSDHLKKKTTSPSDEKFPQKEQNALEEFLALDRQSPQPESKNEGKAPLPAAQHAGPVVIDQVKNDGKGPLPQARQDGKITEASLSNEKFPQADQSALEEFLDIDPESTQPESKSEGKAPLAAAQHPDPVVTDKFQHPLLLRRELDHAQLDKDKDRVSPPAGRERALLSLVNVKERERVEIASTSEPSFDSNSCCDYENTEASTEFQCLERYFADSVRISRNKDRPLLSSAENLGADPSEISYVQKKNY